MSSPSCLASADLFVAKATKTATILATQIAPNLVNLLKAIVSDVS
jgi:hypothetical protein